MHLALISTNGQLSVQAFRSQEAACFCRDLSSATMRHLIRCSRQDQDQNQDQGESYEYIRAGIASSGPSIPCSHSLSNFTPRRFVVGTSGRTATTTTAAQYRYNCLGTCQPMVLRPGVACDTRTELPATARCLLARALLRPKFSAALSASSHSSQSRIEAIHPPCVGPVGSSALLFSPSKQPILLLSHLTVFHVILMPSATV